MAIKGKILLIDDDVDFVTMNRAILEHSGYEVLAAFGGQEGIELARREQPDLVVMDVMMDDTTEGFDLSRQFRTDALLSRLPIILLTSINLHFRPLSFKPDDNWIPVDRLLDKPVRPQQLLNEIETVLKSRRPPHGDAGYGATGERPGR
ncbi:MAG TPA: response regulator [Chloroflexota bacterium]|nr:response regulator [Chloroflexota bacterium]